MAQETTVDMEYPDVFPRGTYVRVWPGEGWEGMYMGNAGARWQGQKHRVQLPDGRNRYVEAEYLEAIIRLEPVGGQLKRWGYVRTERNFADGEA